MKQKLELRVTSPIELEWTEFQEYFILNKETKFRSVCNSRVSIKIICDLIKYIELKKNIAVKMWNAFRSAYSGYSFIHPFLYFPFYPLTGIT
jgi:hypothetical protein